MRILTFAFLLFCSSLSQIISAQPQVAPIQPELNPPSESRVASLFVGTFSDAGYKGPKLVEAEEQLLLGEPIWQERNDGAWVYMKWIKTEAPDKPLTEVFVHFQHFNKDTFTVQVFPIPEEVMVNGSYQKPNTEAPHQDCRPEDLLEIKGCGYLLVQKDKEHYTILHNENYCPFENGYSPLPYFDLAAEIRPGELSFNTQFFDFNQKEVFRYQNHSYKKL